MAKRKQEFPLFADQGQQFGRTFYQAMMDFSQLENFFRVFGDVQRQPDNRHAKQIAEYVLDLLNNEALGIIPTITVNARGPVRFDEDERKLYLDYKTMLSINDGQHRYVGIQRAITYLRAQVDKLENTEITRSKLTADELAERLEATREKLTALENMTVSIFINDNLTEEEEQQIFTDINKSQKKVNKSKALMYDHRDAYSRLMHDIMDEWQVPEFIEIQSDQDKLGDNDPEFTLFNTLVQMLKHMTGGKGKNRLDITNATVAEQVKERMKTLFYHLTVTLPADICNREKYVLANSITLQAIAKQAFEWSRTAGIDFESTVEQLAHIDWTHYAWMNDGLVWDGDKNRVVFKGSSYIKVIQEGIAKRVVPIVNMHVDNIEIAEPNFDDEVAATKVQDEEVPA